MRRRQFIALSGGAAAAWPLAARAQQPAMLVVGFFRSTSAAPFANVVQAFRKGLSEEGFIEGRNVAVEQRWADNQPDRLPGLASDLAARKPAVVVANTPALEAARVVMPTVPIVFVVGDDPVKMGLVASLSRPEGNLTGVTFFGGSLLGAKRLELLRELVPGLSVVAVLVDPVNPAFEAGFPGIEAAARSLGLRIVAVKLATEHDLDAAFDRMVAAGAGGVAVQRRPDSPQPAPAGGRAGGPPRAPDDLRIARLRRGGRPDQLFGQLPRRLSPGGHLRRPHSQGRQAVRITGAATDHVRAGDQPQDRQGARPHRAADAAGGRRRGGRVRRREFITLLGSAPVAWPLAARAQQLATPLVGFLDSVSVETRRDALVAFRQGLGETGHLESHNVAIEYRWAQGQLNRLPDLAADLVRRQVAVIVVNNAASRAARGATSVTPIVFVSGADPVRTGLVSNLRVCPETLDGIAEFSEHEAD